MKYPTLFLLLLVFCTTAAVFLSHFSAPRLLSTQLLSITPERSEEQIVLRFSRPMKTEGFEKHLSFEPNITGRLNWAEGVLHFTPHESLPAGKQLVIHISSEAEDVYGRALGREKTVTLSLPQSSFVYINGEGQLTRGTLQGEQKVLTKGKVIRQFILDGSQERVWYLHQPHPSDPTELWQLDLRSGKQERWLKEKNFQIRSLSIARKGAELILLTQPLLAKTNEALSAYRLNLSDKTLQQIELGELGLTLSSLSVSGDGNTLVVTTLDGAQYLRTLVGEKMITLTKLSNYRGSNRAGTLLVFENIVPDKNYAGEVVLYDGGVKPIVADEATLLMPSLSLDGKFVAYSFQLRSAFAEQAVQAGQALAVAFTLPVNGVRRQAVNDLALEWEHYDPTLSFELPKFSPDASTLAVEVFTKEQLQDLRNIREYGEPNKPALGTLRFFDRSGKLLPQEFVGRELQWVDAPRTVIIE